MNTLLLLSALFSSPSHGSTCGNGIVEGGEECDGQNLNGAHCGMGDDSTTEGLTCDEHCELDAPPFCALLMVHLTGLATESDLKFGALKSAAFHEEGLEDALRLHRIDDDSSGQVSEPVGESQRPEVRVQVGASEPSNKEIDRKFMTGLRMAAFGCTSRAARAIQGGGGSAEMQVHVSKGEVTEVDVTPAFSGYSSVQRCVWERVERSLASSKIDGSGQYTVEVTVTP